MPSERFHQLKTVKKKNFLRHAYQEFALHSYEGASISKLVSTLKMAKGSIYQYFEDKEDLYLFLVTHAREQLQNLLEQACPLPTQKISFNNWYRNFLVVQLKFHLSLPSYGLLLLRNYTDQKGIILKKIDDLQSTYLMRAANRTDTKLSKEKIHQLSIFPLTVFEYILDQNDYNIEELILSKVNIDISSQELLNLCDRFLE